MDNPEQTEPQPPSTAGSQSLTSPLDIRRRLSSPKSEFITVPFLDILLIGLFFTLVSSRYIFAPGISIDLPKVSDESVSGSPAAAVLTIRENKMILFQGEIHKPDSIKDQLERYNASRAAPGAILLIKTDRNVVVQEILEVSDLARQAGFSGIQIATESQELDQKLFGPTP